VRSVIILGSSGSIGTQALDVIRANPRRFDVVGLAVGSNRALLDVQAAEFSVEHTAVGIEEAEQLVRDVDADVVLNGITGSVGLGPTLAALERGTTLALANKESLIVGGDLVTRLAKPGQIVPVDSEHSAIAQALRSGTHGEVRRLVLTASGGPFRGRRRDELTAVTPAEALAHPTWDMGLVVTTSPMSQVGWASASAGVTSASSARVRPRNGPPEAVSTSRRTSSGVPERSACAMAECSESTGTIWPGAASLVTRSPPTIRDSLLASASVVPRSSTASVGARPTDPVMPLSTTSASTSRTNCTASSMPTAVCSTPNSAACASSTARLEPTASPTTSNRRGFARMTSSAWVPIEPDEPRMMTLRTIPL
jgi:hypothetical protein